MRHTELSDPQPDVTGGAGRNIYRIILVFVTLRRSPCFRFLVLGGSSFNASDVCENTSTEVLDNDDDREIIGCPTLEL